MTPMCATPSPNRQTPDALPAKLANAHRQREHLAPSDGAHVATGQFGQALGDRLVCPEKQQGGQAIRRQSPPANTSLPSAAEAQGSEAPRATRAGSGGGHMDAAPVEDGRDPKVCGFSMRHLVYRYQQDLIGN
jgi:hypothetical protein